MTTPPKQHVPGTNCRWCNTPFSRCPVPSLKKRYFVMVCKHCDMIDTGRITPPQD